MPSASVRLIVAEGERSQLTDVALTEIPKEANLSWSDFCSLIEELQSGMVTAVRSQVDIGPYSRNNLIASLYIVLESYFAWS